MEYGNRRVTSPLRPLGVGFTNCTPDLRPAVIFDQVLDATIQNLSIEGNPAAESTLRFTGSKQVLLTAPRVLAQAATFLQLEGTGNNRIVVDGGDISSAATALSFKDGATSSAVKLRQ